LPHICPLCCRNRAPSQPISRRSLWWASLTLLGSLLFAGGCASPTGDWSTSYWPGGPVNAAKSPETGRYKLYASDNSKLIRKVTLREGDKIGFARDAKGRLAAVAGVKC
jgi:hypothetical protein